jgi:hypothetical protein
MKYGSADLDPDPHQNVMDPQHCFNQCCGSKSRIWCFLDPWIPGWKNTNPRFGRTYWECGSGSSSVEIYQNYLTNIVSCLSKKLLYLRWYVLTFSLLSVYFSCKNSTFWDCKVGTRSGFGSGSARIRIGLGHWIRIRIYTAIKGWIRIHIKTNVDPQHIVAKNRYW